MTDKERKLQESLAQAKRLLADGEADTALRLCLELLEAYPENTDVHFLIGLAAQSMGQYTQAASHLGRYVQARPDDARGWTSLGCVLQVTGRRVEGAQCLRRALHIDPDFADAHATLGTVLQAEQALEQALASYREALRREPAHPVALAGLATVLETQGRAEDALRLVEAAGAALGSRAEMDLIRARLMHRLGSVGEARELLEGLVRAGGLSELQQQRAHFALGDLYDGGSDYTRAFEHYRIGNRMKHAHFDVAGHHAYVDRLMRTFSVEARGALPGSGLEDERPVFLVGMPCAGTALLGRMLAGHPEVFVASALDRLPTVAGRLQRSVGASYPECIAELAPGYLPGLARELIAGMSEDEAGVQRVVDQLPLNFEHLGLIHTLLPRARIIHCIRDPLDTALSCYMRNFGLGALPFSADLEHIDAFYRNYRRLMAHWSEALDLRCLELRYETLVGKPESALETVLKFLGLKADADFLRNAVLEAEDVRSGGARSDPVADGCPVGHSRMYLPWLEPLQLAHADAGETLSA